MAGDTSHSPNDAIRNLPAAVHGAVAANRPSITIAPGRRDVGLASLVFYRRTEQFVRPNHGAAGLVTKNVIRDSRVPRLLRSRSGLILHQRPAAPTRLTAIAGIVAEAFVLLPTLNSYNTTTFGWPDCWQTRCRRRSLSSHPSSNQPGCTSPFCPEPYGKRCGVGLAAKPARYHHSARPTTSGSRSWKRARPAHKISTLRANCATPHCSRPDLLQR